MSNNKTVSAPCMWMRGGTSKGAYFLANDLPQDQQERDEFLLAIMGSPDSKQIDGMGGATPLTSKVAIIKPSERPGIDVDYLFLQVFVDQPIVSDGQNCGNILAGVAPFAIERGLVDILSDITNVSIYMENTGQVATCEVNTPNKEVCYRGDVAIDGVPNSASPIAITFKDTAGSTCGALLPTGNEFDIIDETTVTLIDNGMPVVVIRAIDMGITGQESPQELESNDKLRQKLERIRLEAGQKMNLGDVTEKSIPKLTMVSEPTPNGSVSTRTFIPHRCHASIGVLGAVSVATACMLPESPAFSVSTLPEQKTKRVSVEHPAGELSVILQTKNNQVQSAAILRTARKLFDGTIFQHG
ncbi:4-oxalomesaconate tautomerase [Vibrio sp. SS-MA-C1-2]|uniref:4-oxalomesaconate tautomerase n=1 Tax=Vibrio sp. SS-MA-C1-2 TaxID=2908646 RepID=UPI001F220652|nr:4-oxalomesaconate tautomerase [Vibrio sp. SS-MA-C1-2]UJF17849.1 4-oxalomesaconate tautomerase [Vibrio sp. SS-MA-C1-2]